MKSKLLIIGASGHGKVVADIALSMGNYKSIEFLDKNELIKECLGIKVITDTNQYDSYIDSYDFIVAIGNNETRKSIMMGLESLNATFATLVHPDAIIGTNVFVNYGTVVMAGVIINNSTKIGKGCILNTSCTVDHDNMIEDFVHVSPGAHLAGTVEIGSQSWIGIGCVVSNNIKICSRSIIGAGAVVTKDIFESGIYIGCPARRMD